MDGITRNLDLSEAILDLAHRYFCYYRDYKNKLTEEPKRIAQCLILVSILKTLEFLGITKKERRRRNH